MTSYGPYPLGDGREAYGDPLRVYRRLSTGLGGDPNKWLDRYYAAEGLDDDEARDKVNAAAGWAFELVPFDRATGAGATEALVESVLTDFLEYLEKNGPPAVTSRTWSRPTAPESSPSTETPPSGCNSG